MSAVSNVSGGGSSDGVKFSLERMAQLHDEAETYETSFKNSIEEIKSLVETIGTMWTSEETGTYEKFKELFDEKYPKLTEGDDLMKEFCSAVETKMNEFNEAATQSMNLFD